MGTRRCHYFKFAIILSIFKETFTFYLLHKRHRISAKCFYAFIDSFYFLFDVRRSIQKVEFYHDDMIEAEPVDFVSYKINQEFDHDKIRNERGYQIENFVDSTKSNYHIEWIISVACFGLFSLVIFGSALAFWKRREKNRTERFKHYVARDGLLDLERISEDIAVGVARDGGENTDRRLDLPSQSYYGKFVMN